MKAGDPSVSIQRQALPSTNRFISARCDVGDVGDENDSKGCDVRSCVKLPPWAGCSTEITRSAGCLPTMYPFVLDALALRVLFRSLLDTDIAGSRRDLKDDEPLINKDQDSASGPQ